jgi:LPXTG-site transpeptidase (sortase) family protein
LRYFDGQRWTGHTTPAPQPGAGPAAPPRVSLAPAEPTTGRKAATWATRRTVGLVAIACAVFVTYGAWTQWGSLWYAKYQQHQLAQNIQKPTDLNAAGPATLPGADTGPLEAPAPSAKPSKKGSLGDKVTAALGPRNEKTAGARAIGRIQIPSIGVDQVFVQGTSEDDLALGPGLWENGHFPGDPGNAMIAGHRQTHGSPFYHLPEVKVGDKIIISAPGRADAVFEVRGTRVVTPDQVGVAGQTPGVRLTVSTCTPINTSRLRFVLQAEEIQGANVGQALAADKWKFHQ